MLNKTGPRTEPWGMTLVPSHQWTEPHPLWPWAWPLSRFFTQPAVPQSMPWAASFSRRLLWKTASNALLKSRYTTSTASATKQVLQMSFILSKNKRLRITIVFWLTVETVENLAQGLGNIWCLLLVVGHIQWEHNPMIWESLGSVSALSQADLWEKLWICLRKQMAQCEQSRDSFQIRQK